MTAITILRRSFLPYTSITASLRCIHCQRINVNRLRKWMDKSGSVITEIKESRFYRGIHDAKYISNQGTTHEVLTTTSLPPETKESFGLRVLKGIGYLGGFYSRTAVLQRTSKSIYESCADGVDYEQVFLACKMADTFQSWFLVLQLHVWMCLVRLKAEGNEGRQVYRVMVELMWKDVEERLKLLGIDSSTTRSQNMQQLNEQFYGLILAYDEGIISDDAALSSALWRNMFNGKNDADILQVAALTGYVRRQMYYMDGLNSEKLLAEGIIKWLPLYEHQKSDTETTSER